MGDNYITCFVNLNEEPVTESAQGDVYTKHLFACRLHVTEMKLIATEAGAVGPMSGSGHLQG